MKSFNIPNKYLKQILENIQDGIIVMNQNREILAMNPSAHRLTGWNPGDHVPYCSFCESRETKPGEDKCYLIAREEVPYFLSQMPVYHGEKIDVEMSTALMFQDSDTNQKEYLLVLRDQTLRQKEEEVKLSKKMIKQLIEAQENEHKRLAHELHDGVSQSLYTISVAMEAVETRVQDERLLAYLNEVRDELENVMADIKSYSHQLRPKSLDSLGLIPTIQSLIQSVTRSKPELDIQLEHNFNERLPSVVEINLYRVIQEALHNILKYAEARNVKILIRKEPAQIFLRVKDDGKGFDPDTVQNGLGIQHMRERIEQLEGEFRVHSEPGRGTIISAIAQIVFEGSEPDD
ncbi:MAG: PAS domain-containing sensor histidine kinase [Bacillaceae bacterium]|nr:PAS domain-containing sensor histidine kinase [Bacillaceae bacterium]